MFLYFNGISYFYLDVYRIFLLLYSVLLLLLFVKIQIKQHKEIEKTNHLKSGGEILIILFIKSMWLAIILNGSFKGDLETFLMFVC